MIQNLELQLYNSLPAYWNQMVTDIGTSSDLIPQIFAGLPATGTGGANQASISALFQKRTVGASAENMTFLLQYPAINSHIPCVSIEVMEEQEDEVIGGTVYVDTTTNDYTTTYKGGPFVKKYSIGIWSWVPDETLYAFAAIKYCLLDIRSYFQQSSTFHITARPMQVNANQFEAPVYFRYIDIVLEGVLDTVQTNYGTIVTEVILDPTITVAKVDLSETID